MSQFIQLCVISMYGCFIFRFLVLHTSHVFSHGTDGLVVALGKKGFSLKIPQISPKGRNMQSSQRFKIVHSQPFIIVATLCRCNFSATNRFVRTNKAKL